MNQSHRLPRNEMYPFFMKLHPLIIMTSARFYGEIHFM